jgi:hypothetical protein
MAREIHRAAGFEKDLKHLTRKHPELNRRVDDLLNEIATATGALPGDRIPGLGNYAVYKDRVAIGNRGKSAGARLIYYCAEQLVIPIAIYAKGDLANLSIPAIKDALEAAGVEPPPEEVST